ILSVILLLPVVLLMRFVGCSSFGSSATEPPPVAIDPSDPTNPISLGPGETRQFTAKVDDNTAVTWSATAGAVSVNGLYTAPDPFISNSKTATIKATKQSDPTKSASVSINLIDATITLSQSTS